MVFWIEFGVERIRRVDGRDRVEGFPVAARYRSFINDGAGRLYRALQVFRWVRDVSFRYIVRTWF